MGMALGVCSSTALEFNLTPLALVLLSFLVGCATAPSVGRRFIPPPSMTGEGSAGGFPARKADLFQTVQAATGLRNEVWHPVGVPLDLEQAHRLLGELAKTPVPPGGFAPRRVLCWLLREVLEGGEPVEYAELQWRAERFGFLVLVRPDGYLVDAVIGAPLQRMGPLVLLEGQWRVGRFVVGDFYFSRGGVFYPVDAALRRVMGPPLGELGLGRDPLNAALDGAQDALGEMMAALAQSILHPIRTVEELACLPTSVALLIASSPEYFARYGAMSREDQIREAARLSTHVVMLLGSTGASMGRLGGMGAELLLTARGEMVLSRGVEVTASTTRAWGIGATSIVYMAGRDKGKAGSEGDRTEASPKTALARSPGRWTYKKPTTQSVEALDYQEQVTGRPAWWVYMVDHVEFDGFNGTELLEAKGSSYKKFLTKRGTAQPWFEAGEGFKDLMAQARGQSQIARRLNVPVTWHVAEAEFAQFLRKIFADSGWDNIDVRHSPPSR
jgi:hypothetical protein